MFSSLSFRCRYFVLLAFYFPSSSLKSWVWVLVSNQFLFFSWKLFLSPDSAGGGISVPPIQWGYISRISSCFWRCVMGTPQELTSFDDFHLPFLSCIRRISSLKLKLNFGMDFWRLHRFSKCYNNSPCAAILCTTWIFPVDSVGAFTFPAISWLLFPMFEHIDCPSFLIWY